MENTATTVITTLKRTAVEVEPDWENDGFLRIRNAETLKRYRELRDEAYHLDTNQFDMFFAFNPEQFEEGMKKIRPLKDGERLVRLAGGGFCTKDGLERYRAWHEAHRQKIATECDPYEVYVHECNNHESCIAWDGDMEAVLIVADIWGDDVARQISPRFHKCHSLEGILQDRR